MDRKKSNYDKPFGGKQGSLPVPVIGNWTIEKNFPYGFVIRNVDPNSLGTEYHFLHDSNGWVSVRNKTAKPTVFGAHGPMPLTPNFCDAESTMKDERIRQLRKKGHSLTQAETKELLVLSGLIKGE